VTGTTTTGSSVGLLVGGLVGSGVGGTIGAGVVCVVTGAGVGIGISGTRVSSPRSIGADVNGATDGTGVATTAPPHPQRS
jgi:hypothetical protein